MKVDYKKSVVGVAFMHIIVSFMKVGFESKSAHILQIKSSLYSRYYGKEYSAGHIGTDTLLKKYRRYR